MNGLNPETSVVFYFLFLIKEIYKRMDRRTGNKENKRNQEVFEGFLLGTFDLFIS